MKTDILDLLIKSLIDAWMTEGIGYGLSVNEEDKLDKKLKQLINSDLINDKTNEILKNYYNP